jgi:hypothetical protein
MLSESKYQEFINLGYLPLVNNLTNTFDESINCDRFKLSVGVSDGGLVRLTNVIDTKLMFDKYLYLSGTSKPFIIHCGNMIEYLKKIINVEDGDLIVDIGGNDGTLLNNFKKEINEKVRLINIDPSDVVKFVTDTDIEIINSYFDHEVVGKIGQKAKLIVSTNVFQHLLDIESFISNITILLKEDGIWCLEFPYWCESMKTLQFDQIYHEHIYYYNVTPLKKIFDKFGLRIFNIGHHKIHGGTLRLLICRKESSYSTDSSLEEYIDSELVLNNTFYKEWQSKIDKHVENCKSRILEISEKNNIVAFGAAAKGCVFLNYLKIDYKTIDYIIDDTEIKKGKFMPGTGLKIYDRKKINEDMPDYILILAHNFKDFIINSLRDYGYKNKFIVCIPKFEILQ